MANLPIRGRGASSNPPNRFERIAFEPEPLPPDPDDPIPYRETQYLRDNSRTLISTNNSPDIPFSASLNLYRGCSHGCIYCYARPFHEYLGLSAGLDFETIVFVKQDAPELLREELQAARWKPQTIALSGVTDPYQPAERHFELTRRCLRILADFRNPVAIITKNFLVTRDVDLLTELAEHQAVSVHISITTLKNSLQRVMEPRTSIPSRRLAAVEILANHDVPVGVMVAPVIPGLTDHEIPAILKAAADAGARFANFIPLRLPHGVADLFQNWLDQHFPDMKNRVLNRIREIRGGKLNETGFGSRMRGKGKYAEQIRALFNVSRAKLKLDARGPQLSTAAFRRPNEQLGLFDNG
ncbi:MAG TPA: PA0069 family radical SAM protein [Longimicrobiales bacterium]